MEYIKINKKIITDRILELEKARETTYNAHKLTSIEARIDILQSILKQSEEIK